jgi:preprotein translocase subunit SecE
MTQKKAVVNPVIGIREELKRVTWPSRAEATQLTVTVIVLSLIVALFVGIIDFSFAQLLGLL